MLNLLTEAQKQRVKDLEAQAFGAQSGIDGSVATPTERIELQLRIRVCNLEIKVIVMEAQIEALRNTAYQPEQAVTSQVTKEGV